MNEIVTSFSRRDLRLNVNYENVEDNYSGDRAKIKRKIVKFNGNFKDHKAYVWAEIDHHYNFSHRLNSLNYREDDFLKKFKYLNINGGGLAEYLQYRRPFAFGYGMKPGNDYQPSLNFNSFKVYKGVDNTGRMYLPGELQEIMDFIEVPALDVFISEPIPDLKDFALRCGLHPEKNRELLQSNFGFMSAVIAASCIKPGGTYIWCIEDIELNLTEDIITFLSFFFKKVSIFNPITCYRRHAVCVDAKKGNRRWLYSKGLIDKLININKEISSGKVITGLFSESDETVGNYIDQANKIYSKMNRSKGKKITQPENILSEWSLPSQKIKSVDKDKEFPLVDEKFFSRFGKDVLGWKFLEELYTFGSLEETTHSFSKRIRVGSSTLESWIRISSRKGTIKFPDIELTKNLINTFSDLEILKLSDVFKSDDRPKLIINYASESLILTLNDLDESFQGVIITPQWPSLTQELRDRSAKVDVMSSEKVFVQSHPILSRNYYIIQFFPPTGVRKVM